jgi:CheY-like chemotaxis protein
MLNMLGYDVEFAEEGTRGVELYRIAQESSKPFSAVILDLTIPGGVGAKEAVRMLRRLDPAVKAIVSSGYADHPTLADYEKHGFSGVAPKPYTARALGEVLKRVLGEHEV